MGNLQTHTCTQHLFVSIQCSHKHIHVYIECTVLLTSVKDLLDDAGHLSLQHGVEQLNDEDEAGTEHQQRKSQKDQTHCQIRQVHIHKEMFTCRGKKIHIMNATSSVVFFGHFGKQ